MFVYLDEMTHYLSFAQPRYVFCDKWQADNIKQALQALATVVAADDEESLRQFALGHSDDVETFEYDFIYHL